MKPGPQSTLARLLTPSFLIAVVLLGTAAVLAGPFAKWMRFKQNKAALPLRSALGALEPERIAPYRVVDRISLEPAVVEALGTSQYLCWVLEDTSVDQRDPLRRVELFVTYYSGGNDLVPHTPDVCFVGGGYQPAQPHENIELELPWNDPRMATIPVRVCTFAKTAIFDHKEVSVVYTFHCNGEFVATRTGVRFLVNRLANTYAYFSKVEVRFPWATRAQTIEGAKKLLARVLPILSGDHWPDFEAAEQRAQRKAR